MKKFYTLLTFAVLSSATFAQRNIDLKLTLSTPVEGSTVPKSNAQNITFTIENNGSDFMEGDSLYIYYVNLNTETLYSLAGAANYTSYFVLNATAVTGLNAATSIPSTTFNSGNQMTLNTNATGFNEGDEILVVAELIGGASNPGSEGQSTFLDNIGSFKLGAAQVSITDVSKMNFIAFPNPATDVLNITSDEEIVSINVLSLDGKIAATSTSSSVNVSNLTAGVYVYEVTSVNGNKAINKFVKK